MIARRDLRVMALVGAAHFCSHFFQLAVPSLFPLIREDLGVSYTELGFAVSIFFAVSAVNRSAGGFAKLAKALSCWFAPSFVSG